MKSNIFQLNIFNVFNQEESELKAHFEAHGKVAEIHLVVDKYTEQLRGFGFVTMEDNAGMLAVIENLDGKTFGGRDLKINEARPRENNSGGGGGGGYGGGNRGGGQSRSGGGSRKGQRDNDRW